MRKTITIIALMVLVTFNVMARPISRIIYDGGTCGVTLNTDTDFYGKDFKNLDENKIKAEILAHYNSFLFRNYFVLDPNKNNYKMGQAKGMDLWITKFGDLLKQADELIDLGYNYVCLIYTTDDSMDEYGHITGECAVLAITNTGLVFGFWDY